MKWIDKFDHVTAIATSIVLAISGLSCVWSIFTVPPAMKALYVLLSLGAFWLCWDITRDWMKTVAIRKQLERDNDSATG